MVRGRRERAVLVAMVMSVGEVVSVDRLAEAVWGDRAPASKAKVVQNLVLRLRKVLGADVIETRPSGYVLCVDPDATDLHRFDRSRREGRVRLVAGDRDEAAAMFEVACGLWRGQPLVDLADHPSANGEAEYLMEELRQTREALAEVALALGRHGEWVPALEAMVVEEPLREGRWGLLMLALHGCGRHADALRAFQRARAALVEVGLEPGPDLRALERRLCADHVGVSLSWSGAGVLGNVRPPMTSWIGSADHLRERARDLVSSRLVTLVGPGGVGKTRLAIEAGLLNTTRFPGGVWFIDLAPIATPEAVVGVVAATIGARLQAASVDAVVACLSARPPALLILDNCEHLRSSAAEVVAAVESRSPSTTVLATSREPLGLAGERIVTVESMSPGDAFELFSQRAEAVDDSVVVTESDRPTVEAICRRLDGIPLAIELAAGRVRTSTLTDILERLDDRFRLLRGGPGPRRQQTLRATVAWSHDLLDDGASTVFERASVFAGGFDAEAARAVLGRGCVDEADVVATLDDLVQKSMVVADRRGDRVRYGLAETLREFGGELLDRSGEGREVRRRHVDHFLGVARRADQLWVSPRQVEASAIFAREWDNVRAAQHWAAVDDPDSAASLVAATGAYAYSNRDDEHGDWASVALRRLPPDCAARSSLLGWSAVRRYLAHDWGQTLALAVSGIDASHDDDQPGALLCRCMAIPALRSGCDVEGARAMAAALRPATALCTDVFMRNAIYLALIEQAFWTDLGDAPALVSEYSNWAHSLGTPSICSMAEFSTGRVKAWVRQPQDFDGAIGCYHEGLRLAQSVRDLRAETANLLGLAFVHSALDSDAASSACQVALVRLRDLRSVHGLLLLLDAVLGWFLRTG